MTPTKFEALTIPAQVNYVGKGANLYKLGYEPHGSVSVINNYLGTTWLWEKVRVQGGAYGGFSAFDTHSGTFTFLSYRDPNLLATLDTYDKTVDFLTGSRPERRRVEEIHHRHHRQHGQPTNSPTPKAGHRWYAT